MDWYHTTLWPLLRPLFLGFFRTPPEKRDPAMLEKARIGTADGLRILDAHLASHEHVAGGRFTMGDIPLGCAIWRWMALPIELPALANVQRWFESLSERPAYKKVVLLPLT